MTTTEQLVSQLQNTSKTKEKQRIIEEGAQENLNFQYLLKCTCNPYILSHIKTLDVEGKSDLKFDSVISENQETVAQQFFYIYDQLHKRVITGQKALDTCSDFISKLDPCTAEMVKNSLKKDLRCAIGVKIINKAFQNIGVDTIPEFNVQKANKYNPEKQYETDTWWASPKLDGLRCIYIDGNMYTRTGKSVVGFDHIMQECKDLQVITNNEIIDGELFSPNLPFQTIQSYVTKSKNIDEEEKKQICFHVFAVTTLDNSRAVPTEDMHKLLKQIVNVYNYIKPVLMFQVKNNAHEILKIRDEFVDDGYEGVMLRHPDIPYEWKRSNALLKYKPILEDDFLVSDYFEGKGKYQGLLGGLYVENKTVLNGGTNIRISSEVGSGFSDSERKSLWENADNLIGKTVEIEYQNITDKPVCDGEGDLPVYSLRFPVFKKWKEDR